MRVLPNSCNVLSFLGVSPSKRRWGAAFLVFTLSFASPSLAQTESANEDTAGARALAMEGIKAFETGRYADAEDLLSRAEGLVHAPTQLLYLARAIEKQGRLVEARETLIRLKNEVLPDSAPGAFRTAQESARSDLRELEPRVPYLTIRLAGDGAKDATVHLNGEPFKSVFLGAPHPVDPGKVTIEARADGACGQQSVTLEEGERREVTLTLEACAAEPAAQDGPAEQRSGSPLEDQGSGSGANVPAYTAFGIGAIGVGLGAVFLTQYMKNNSDANSTFDACNESLDCGQTEKDTIDELDGRASKQGALSTISFGMGAVGLGAGVALLLLDGKKGEPKSESRSVRPYFTGQHLGLAGTF